MACRDLPEMPAAPVLELHGQRKVFHIQAGLKGLLEEFTREVLKHQPEDIYVFLAQLLEDKLPKKDENEEDEKSREEKRKSWEWRRWSWDGSSLLTDEELEEFMSQYNITFEMASVLATIIQSVYRGYMGRKKYKGMKKLNDEHKKQLWEEWTKSGPLMISGKEVLEILSYYKISLFEANAFATKIQKLVRGYTQRAKLERNNPELDAKLRALDIRKNKTYSHHHAHGDTNAQDDDEAALEAGFELIEEDFEWVGEFEMIEGEMGAHMGENLKYKAFFPQGIKDVKKIEEGVELPPKFEHELFGEIDPKALQQKFSTPEFKKKMSLVLKGIEETKKENFIRMSESKLVKDGKSTTTSESGKIVEKVPSVKLSKNMSENKASNVKMATTESQVDV